MYANIGLMIGRTWITPIANFIVALRVRRQPVCSVRGRGIEDNEHFSIVLTQTHFTFTSGSFTLTGTYVVNPEELFIMVTVEDALEEGESILATDEHWWKGQVSRWAFAPTEQSNQDGRIHPLGRTGIHKPGVGE